MNRIFVKQGVSLVGIVVLLLAGLAGCGGDEPAPVVRPPAPPPAPPAFEPEAVEVALGEEGGTVTLMTTEAGGFTLDGEAFESGGMVTAENGNVYTLTLADGAWTAAFNAPMEDVMLGMHGGSVTVTTAEDGTYWVPGQDTAFESGGMVMGENGMYYTLTLADGEWTAAFNAPAPVMVDLGMSGSTATIEVAENGTYWVAGELFESGGTVTAENGNMYMLTLMDGEWSAAFQAEMMDIEGIDMMAASTEDGMGYTVGDQMLDENGMGDIMVDGYHFRVMMDDMGMFTATQFDAMVDGQASLTDREASASIFGGLLADDPDTAMNEAGTMVTIDGQKHSISDLFSGMSVKMGDNIVGEQVKAIEKAKARIEALIAVIKAGDAEAEERGTQFTDLFQARWQDIDNALGQIFGDLDDPADLTDIDHLSEAAPDQNLAKIVAAVDEVLAALASLEAFTEALGDGGLFVDSKGSIKDEDIATVFDAVPAQWTVNFGKTMNTRYGVYGKQVRAGNLAISELAAAPSTDTDAQPARYGAFAYSPHKPSKAGDLPSSGEAYYIGETIAQEQDKFKIYKGTIELQIRFRSKGVKGLISDLMDADGKRYSTSNGAVDTILLPAATMDNNASWLVGDGTDNATVIHVPVLGGAGSATMDANFKGQMVGEGDSAGAAIIGTWALMDDRTSPTDEGNLVGAYGAERGPDRPITPPDVDPTGEKSETSLAADNASPVTDKGMIQVGDDPTSDDATKMIEVAVSDLLNDGEETVMGMSFVDSAKAAIEKQVDRLNAFIALDDANGDDTSVTANTGREGVWDALDNNTSGSEGVIQTIFGTTYDHNGDDTDGATEPVRVLSGGTAHDPAATTGDPHEGIEQYPITDENKPDDVTAKEEITDLLTALGSVEEFEKATAKGGDLYGQTTTSDDEDGLLDGQKAADVFNRVPYTVTVRYGHTDYTRFGAWFRTGSATAKAAPSFEAANTGQFAYSPLKQTADDKYPIGGNATYEGRTIARDTTINADQTVPKFYHGDIQLRVDWADAGEAVTTSTVTAIVSNLMDADGGMFADPDATDAANNKVMMIILGGTVTDTDDVLAFTGSTTRVRYEGFGVAERTGATGSVTGKFVAESIDGPRGIIGTWGLGSNLLGVYGADIQP